MRRPKPPVDKSFLLIVFFFLGLGLVQVYSSSFILAMEKYGDGLHIFKRQLLFSLLGVFTLYLGLKMPQEWLRKLTPFFWLVASCILLLTFVPGFGIRAGGAQRWLRLPFEQRFEPAEFIKLLVPYMMASYIARSEKPSSWVQWVLHVLFLIIPLVLLLFQPDFGTFAICIGVVFLVLFAFGLNWKFIAAGFTLALPAFYFLVLRVPYREARIRAFLDPWSDPAQKGFQVIQSMLAFSSGGLWGEGLGQGQGKLFFLPEAHTDFTLAVLGEETGYVGFLVVVILYGILVFKGMQISLRAQDSFTRAASLGWSLMFGLSVFINVGVVLGLLPTKGLTLPFLSYGGSSLVMTCLGFGWLLSLDRQTRKNKLEVISRIRP
ncbi:MAG: putative lipid II flippase FtsW [Bdellovibrionales bacterium]|nr:putative lipid II flippase FtsW [Bdellovibrionales bacterium]